MKHILTCSFGKDSIATALLALQHGEPLDELVYSEVMFSDPYRENCRKHKRFIYETAIPYLKVSGDFPQGSCAGKRHIWTAFTTS